MAKFGPKWLETKKLLEKVECFFFGTSAYNFK